MQGLRKDLAEIFPVEEAFVFSRDFLYWEEVGVIGPSVFHGFFTLMIATVPLSQSVTYVFRTFFKMFFLVGLHGGCQGLFLLPVLLATFGGDNLETEEQKPNTPKELEVGIGLDA